MTAVSLRVFGHLNDFLPYARRRQTFTLQIEGTPSVKDLIESVGVPHTEMDIITANGVSVDFAYLVREADHIEVFPLFSATTTSPLIHLIPQPPQEMRFILDVHLGRLAAYLRMLGFDTAYENACDDPVLAQRSHDEGRILLTRDVGLLKRGVVTRGYFVRETQPDRQIEEVVRRYALMPKAAPFSRCLRCNAPTVVVLKADIKEQLISQVHERYDEFSRCPGCGQIYWKGSHYQHMELLVARLMSDTAAERARHI
ncbi:MAG TPA: Mut7-C RNAse domain-containing protein [Ktedonobacterales bacterium]